MIEIWLNGERADLSKDTIVGLTKKPFDITKVPTVSIEHSNKFKLPKTETNNRIFDFCAFAGSGSSVPYDSLTCKIIDGFVIGNGTAILDGVDDNYNIIFYSDKKTFIDEIAGVTVGEVIDAYIDYLTPSGAFNLGSTWAAAVANLAAGWNGVTLPLQTQYVTGSSPIVLQAATETATDEFTRGCELWFDIEDILYNYCVDAGYTISIGSIPGLSIPARHAAVKWEYNSGAPYWYVGYEAAYTETESWLNFSMLDLIRMYARKFNCYIDIDEASKSIVIKKFADLYSTQDTSLNDKLVSYTKKFVLSNYAQTNIISFKPDKDVDVGHYNATFAVNNANISESSKYLEIESLAPKYLYYEDYEWNDFSISPEAEYIPMMRVDTADLSDTIQVRFTTNNVDDATTYAANDNLPKLKWYDSSSFFQAMEAPIFNQVEAFDVEVRMTSIDYDNVSVYKKYFFERLGGDFIINKVSGFNPSNKGTTKLELIRIR